MSRPLKFPDLSKALEADSPTDESLEAALLKCDGDRAATARELGISVRTLARRLRGQPHLRHAHEFQSDDPLAAKIFQKQVLRALAGNSRAMMWYLRGIGWGKKGMPTITVLSATETAEFMMEWTELPET